MATVAGLVVALAASAFAVVTVMRDDGGAEIYLEAAAKRGPDPFTESFASPLVTVSDRYVAAGSGGDGVILSVAGDEPGLYGGSRDEQSCDTAKLVEFLRSQPEKASAWAGVLGIGAGDIGAYVGDLVPVVLRADTRVTNHGFVDGRATSRQAVLQAGTAVLIDSTGVPRVRCSCGNPLLEPEQVEAVYSGEAWPEFDEGDLVAVADKGRAESIVLTDLATGDTYEPDRSGLAVPTVEFRHLRPANPDPGGTIDVIVPSLSGDGFVAANRSVLATAQEQVDHFVNAFDRSVWDEYVGSGVAGVCTTCGGALDADVQVTGVSDKYVSMIWDARSIFSYSLNDSPSAWSITVDLASGDSVPLSSAFSAPTWREDLAGAALVALGTADCANPDF